MEQVPSNKQQGFRSRDQVIIRPTTKLAAEAPSWTQPRIPAGWVIRSGA